MLGTVLAFLVPMIGGFLIAKMQQNDIARYIWISGLLIFSVVCVWVLDLPTGNGLCEKLRAVEKLWRTFFDYQPRQRPDGRRRPARTAPGSRSR